MTIESLSASSLIPAAKAETIRRLTPEYRKLKQRYFWLQARAYLADMRADRELGIVDDEMMEHVQTYRRLAKSQRGL